MRLGKKVVIWGALWTACVSALHLSLNFDWSAYVNELRPEDQRQLNVAYIPVT